jgi:hypothetical protein
LEPGGIVLENPDGCTNPKMHFSFPFVVQSEHDAETTSLLVCSIGEEAASEGLKKDAMCHYFAFLHAIVHPIPADLNIDLLFKSLLRENYTN